METPASAGAGPIEVMYEDEFGRDGMGSYLRDTYERMPKKMRQALESRGAKVTQANIFCYLIQPALETIRDATAQQLVKKNQSIISSNCSSSLQ